MGMIIVMFGVLAIAGLAFLLIGLKTLSRKPVILKGYWLTVLIGLCFLPTVINSFYRIISSGSFDVTKDWLGILFLAFFIFLIFIYKKAFGFITLFNVDEDLLYESIFNILKGKNIVYEEKRGKIILPSSNSEIKISTASAFKTAQIHFKLNNNPDLDTAIIEELRRNLTQKTVAKFPLVGVVYVICGLFMFVVLIGLFFMLYNVSKKHNMSIFDIGKYDSSLEKGIDAANNKNWGEAKELLTKACETNPQEKGCNWLSYVAENIGNPVEARELLKIACSKKNARGCADLGILELSLGNKEESAKYFALACEYGNKNACQKVNRK
jgi:hypothetical protein